MRSLVVGTAGHVDHGKSALVEALTGVHPDRLKEERERGITIDLGFAHFPLDDEWTVSFIDVPGHERFVRNMLAGAHGIDAVLLVVAADESVMPQTREHFHICRLLGVRRGLIALTKCDVAEDSLQSRSEADIRLLAAGSFLDGAEVLRVSARTGQGLEELRQALARLARAIPARPPGGIMRLPVDRAFTVKGFGTVVTGTLVSGAIAVGDALEVMPSARPTRVRGLQLHGESRGRVEAGHRCAVNVASLEVGDIARGDVLAHPGTLRGTRRADVALSLLPNVQRKWQTRVRVHCASAEVLARVVPVGDREDSIALAQLRFETDAVLARGDRLILRSYSPATTIGGAEVLDPAPRSTRVGSKAMAGRLAVLRDASWLEAAVVWIREAGAHGIDEGLLAARLGADRRALAVEMRSAREVVRIEGTPVCYLARATLDTLLQDTLVAVGEHHSRFPLQDGMGREELRHRLARGLGPRVLETALAELVAAGRARAVEGRVALPGHRVELAGDERAIRARVIEKALAAGSKGIVTALIVSELDLDAPRVNTVLRLLATEGELERVAVDWHLHREVYASIVADLRRRLRPGDAVDVASVKEATGLTRKHAIPLLEHLDRRRVTRRVGTGRILLKE